MQVEHYQRYFVAPATPESPDAYKSIALAVVWISKCFILNLTRKLQKHVFIEVNGEGISPYTGELPVVHSGKISQSNKCISFCMEI